MTSQITARTLKSRENAGRHLPAETVPEAPPLSHHQASAGTGGDASRPLWPEDKGEGLRPRDKSSSCQVSEVWLPWQQTRSWPCCTRLQPSAGQTGGSLTSAETAESDTVIRDMGTRGTGGQMSHLLSVTGADIVVGQFLVVIVLVVEILQGVLFLQFTELTRGGDSQQSPGCGGGGDGTGVRGRR